MNRRLLRLGRLLGLTYALLICILFLPTLISYDSKGNNIYDVTVNGKFVGRSATSDVTDLISIARKELAAGKSDPLMIEIDTSIVGREVMWEEVESDEVLISNIKSVLMDSEIKYLKRSYTVKANDFTVNIGDYDGVVNLLNAVLNQYDEDKRFSTDLVADPDRELSVLTTNVIADDKAIINVFASAYKEAGLCAMLDEALEQDPDNVDLDFDDYELGTVSVDFASRVEVVECYLPDDVITPTEQAIDIVTEKTEKNAIYEVVAGDTLSEIAEKHNLDLKTLFEMNPGLEEKATSIRVGDEITVTTPEPAISVRWTVQSYYEESYDAPVQYVDNDNWYTNEMKTIQDPSAGFRKVVALVTYVNDKNMGADIQKEELVYEAVPKIVERGTKNPPTYIKPISGGRQSSGFGKRSAPVKGASTYHKGIDWAVPIGTAVMASQGGTVIKAGAASGYGIAVYISHPNGTVTRYGHLSKVLVKAGQTVKQGQKIALSGNTGRSSGPHLHFEILINGVQVNPLKYLS